jgi:hypothetical protein
MYDIILTPGEIKLILRLLPPPPGPTGYASESRAREASRANKKAEFIRTNRYICPSQWASYFVWLK